MYIGAKFGSVGFKMNRILGRKVKCNKNYYVWEAERRDNVGRKSSITNNFQVEIE